MRPMKKTLDSLFGQALSPVWKELPEETLNRLISVFLRPDLDARYHPSSDTISLTTGYGTIRLFGNHPDQIRDVYVNGQGYSLTPGLDGLTALEHLTGSEVEVMLALDQPVGRQKLGRKARSDKSRSYNPEALAKVQQVAEDDLSRSGLSYANLLPELGAILTGATVTANEVATELFAAQVPESDIPSFLVRESQYKQEILAKLYNYNAPAATETYEFVEVSAKDDTFIGRLLSRLNKPTARYDAEKGVLELTEEGKKGPYTRRITNLPYVDERGVFHNKDTAYLPYYIGYFAQQNGTRRERLRLIDPVERAITGVLLQYKLTGRGDVKFKTILDVTRNLPDFENHPYGEEILDTLKHKVVLAPRYHNTNSLLAYHQGLADDLGPVALTMLDEDAAGFIDPYGTSNGRNLGYIFYLTEGAEIAKDGSLLPGREHSQVGDILLEQGGGRDNFNRQQMSFNALLTSLDVTPKQVAVAEFGMWNADDAIVCLRNPDGKYHVGDKVQDFHGNKSVISVILEELSEEETQERHLQEAVEFARLNPDVDFVTSPVSLNSRLNLGILEEGLAGERTDLHLPDGSTVKDGVITLSYMQLPQTAEKKSKDYAIDDGARRYSTLLRCALSSKVGDLYTEGLLDPEVRKAHIDEACAVFARLGVSFTDEAKLTQGGNVQMHSQMARTIDAEELAHLAPAAVRLKLMEAMGDGYEVQVKLPTEMALPSRFGGAIVNESGEPVLPIRVPKGSTIPYRYLPLFLELSRGNGDGLRREHRILSDIDYGALTVKNNLLKNIDTMEFTNGARTSVIVPDPSLPLGSVRSELPDDWLITHRDPAIQSGNATTMHNAGGAAKGVLHKNPLICPMFNSDFDGDTMGEVGKSNLRLSEADKEEFFRRASVEEQLNQYGDVFLGIGSAHFKALALASDVSTDHLTFADGKSNAELAQAVEEVQRRLLDSPKSYGAYALSFENEETVRKGMEAIAKAGIKGNVDEVSHRLHHGYSAEDNRVLAKALLAKSEWTGLAGAATNQLIANTDPKDYALMRTGLDLTHAMTQSVLQMKKNADRLGIIDDGIKRMKKVLRGDVPRAKAKEELLTATDGLLNREVVHTFVDQVLARQDPEEPKFGRGVISHNGATATQLSYLTPKSFEKAVVSLSEPSDELLQQS